MRPAAPGKSEHRLCQVLEMTRDQWDNPTERDTVRANFRKVCECRTAALGGEVYASATEKKVCYHTCKSKCCPSCGNRGTRLWKNENSGPHCRIFLCRHCAHYARPLLASLSGSSPSSARSSHFGAAVLQHWAWNHYRAH